MLFVLLNKTYGQNTLSLASQLREANHDSIRLKIYTQLADTLYVQERFDSLLAITRQAMPLAVKMKAIKYEGRLYYYLSLVYRNQRALSQTLETLKKAVSISSQAQDRETQAKAMYLIQTIYNDQGNHVAAIKQCLINLNYSKQHRSSQLELYTYNLLSVIYEDLGDKKNSKFYLNKSIQMIDRVKTPIERLLIYQNTALFYESQGNDQKAWPYHIKAVNVAKSLTSRKSMQMFTLLHAATNLRKRHQLKEALRYLGEGIKIGKEITGKSIGGVFWNEMALVHIELGNYRQAVWLAQHFVSSSKSLRLAKDIAMGLNTLALAKEKMGHHQQALKFYKEYHLIKDSLLSVDKSIQVARIQAAYESKKREHTIQLLQKKSQLDDLKNKQQQQKLELANQQKLLYITGVILLTILVGIVGYFLQRLYKTQQLLTQKKRKIEIQAQELQEANQLKDHLFTVISHDLRSPVASLKSTLTLLKLQNRIPSELIELEDEVDGLSQIIDNVLYWSLHQRNGLQLRQCSIALMDLVEEAIESFAGFIRQKQLTITVDTLPIRIWTDENMTMLILRNILHNALKFTPVGGAIRISIVTERDQTCLRITDTGIGMSMTSARIDSQAQNKGTGIGLNLSTDLMQRNGGQLTWESQLGRGTSVTLSWPNVKTPAP